MNILWCHPNAWSGEYKMMRHLVALGHRVCVLQSKRKISGARAFTNHFRQAEDGIETFWYEPSKGAEKLLTFPVDRIVRRSSYRGNLGHRMWIVCAAARHFQPDVVFCSEGFGYGVAAALLKRLGGLPYPLVVQFIGGDLMDEPEAGVGVRRTPLSTWLLKQVIGSATCLKPVSPMLSQILQSEGATLDKIRVCPSHQAADTDTLEHAYEHRAGLREGLRQRLGIPSDAPVIVTLSGNWQGKGIHLLAEAWGGIRRRVPGCHWLLAGPHPAWFKEKVIPSLQAYGDDVHLLGELAGTEVFQCLAAADLNVNPTLADGLNMVTVEAAAVGTPSLVTDKAGIAAWVAECDPSLVLPVGDVKALEEGVVAYLSLDARMRVEFVQKFKRMSEGFAVEPLASEFTELLAEAIDREAASNSRPGR